MKVSDFLSTLVAVFEPLLLSVGYKVRYQPLNPEDVAFCKKVIFDDEEVHIQIRVQPSIVNNKAYMFTINLYRNEYDIDMGEYGYDLNANYSLSTRLASWLWVKDRNDFLWESDHWWYFTSQETLEICCEDALWSLMLYGIPWLEEPETKQPY